MQRTPEGLSFEGKSGRDQLIGVWCVHMRPDRREDEPVEVLSIRRGKATLLSMFPMDDPPYTYEVPVSSILDPHGGFVWLGTRKDLGWIHAGSIVHRRKWPALSADQAVESRLSGAIRYAHGKIERIRGTQVVIRVNPFHHTTPEYLRTLITDFARMFRAYESDLHDLRQWQRVWDQYALDQGVTENGEALSDTTAPEPVVTSQVTTEPEPLVVPSPPHWSRLKPAAV